VANSSSLNSQRYCYYLLSWILEDISKKLYSYANFRAVSLIQSALQHFVMRLVLFLHLKSKLVNSNNIPPLSNLADNEKIFLEKLCSYVYFRTVSLIRPACKEALQHFTRLSVEGQSCQNWFNFKFCVWILHFMLPSIFHLPD